MVVVFRLFASFCHLNTMSAKNRSSSSKVCSFCNLAEDNELEYGKIYEHDGIATHYYCLLLSSNMEQKGNDDEGILGFLAEDIQKELRRGKRLVCSYCRKQGATLGCCNVRCKRIFHFPCGVQAGSLHQFFGEFRSYCVNHRPKQKIDDQVLKQVSSVDVICYICYDKVNINDFVKTLWAPCCKKDAWFHRTCVQQLALSAGYFFKCPLCNNKKDFQKAMLEYGIFVPCQDASWELVPNAFEELLFRHDQCDAPKCLCPKGRKYTSNNAKWELALCRTCGSQGIHMSCGQLKWANPVWECDECTSILRNNEHVRLGNSSAICSTSQNRDSDSDLNSDSDSDSDLDSDTDISVGTDFPMPCVLPNSSSTSSLESILDIRLRPGPRSFKLQQQMIKLDKWLNLTSTDLEKNVAIKTSPKSINDSSLLKDDDEKKEPSTSKESKEHIPQQESKEDSSQKEKQSPSKNDETSQPIQKETDVIVIESDDDDVQFVTLTQKTDLLSTHMQQSTQLDRSCLPSTSTLKKITLLDATENAAASKSKSVAINLSKNDHIDLPKSIISGTETKKENESTISKDQINVVKSQESTLDLVTLNNVEIDTKETSEMSVMNIKITNVTSLPREVFESVPDVVCDNITLHTNTTDTSLFSTNETLEQLITHVPSTKRSMHEANNIIDNCKKIKRNSFDEKLHEMNSPTNVITILNTNKTNDNNKITQDAATNSIHNTDRQQSEKTSANKFSEIGQNDKNSSKYPASTNTSNPLLSNNQTNDLSPQYNYIQIHKNDVQHINQILSSLKESGVSVNVHQKNENSVAQTNTTEFVTFAKKNPVLMPIGNGYYLQEISNSSFAAISQNVGRNERNVYAIPSNSVILPHVTDNITVLSNSTVFNPTLLVKQSAMTNVTAPILSDKRIAAVNRQEVTSKRNVSANTSSVENISTSKSYCDGDAGTRPAETGSTNYKDDPPNDSRRRVFGKQTIACQRSIATCSVFPQITNNRNTCHQPGLIPRYVNLQDLKFQVCASNNIQMTLYDTFSVNISMKNFEKRLAGVATPQEAKEMSTFASREASCSSDYIDNISTEKQCSNKLFRSLKNENCSINDKTFVGHDRDDTKENLDPITSRILSHSEFTSDNVNSTSNIDDEIIMNNRFNNENNSETFVSSDTNVSVLNRTICNTNIDSLINGTTLISNNCNKGSRISLGAVQQHKQASVHSAISVRAEERSGAQLFFKETNRIIHSVDFDLNVMNKNIEKISHTSGDRIGNDHTDDSPILRNSLKHLDSMNLIKSKINNQNVTHVANITESNEHSILNKQIDACDSKKVIQRIAFQENTVHHNGEIKAKNNEFCIKVSIDLCKIQNLIDSKPELFKNRKHNANDQWYTRTNRLPSLDNYVRQQVRYCDIENRDSISNCPPKNRELQKSNYACNIEPMQQNIIPDADTFLKYQKSNQEVLDR